METTAAEPIQLLAKSVAPAEQDWSHSNYRALEFDLQVSPNSERFDLESSDKAKRSEADVNLEIGIYLQSHRKTVPGILDIVRQEFELSMGLTNQRGCFATRKGRQRRPDRTQIADDS